MTVDVWWLPEGWELHLPFWATYVSASVGGDRCVLFWVFWGGIMTPTRNKEEKYLQNTQT